MDRRAFLLGTASAAVGSGTALAASPIAQSPDPLPGLSIDDLRGSIGIEFADLTAGAPEDQSTRLQTALDRAALEGKPVFLPPGRYEVSNLVLPSRTKLIGIPGETRLVYTGGGHLFAAEGGSGIRIEGVVLDGANRALGDLHPALLHLHSVADIVVERVEVVGSAAHAVALEACSGRIAASTFSGAREAGIWSVAARGLSIVDNHVFGCGEGGILVHRWVDGDDATIVSRNRVERIEARSGGTGQAGNGINVYRARGVIVSDNQISDCAFSAIRSNSGSNVQIIGNQCVGSGETAIYSEFAFEGAVIANNLIDGGSIGISVANFDQGGRLATVSGNVVRNLHKGAPYPDEMGLGFGIGISVEADTAVTGNVIEKAPTLGMLVGWGPYARNVVATGNVVRNAPIGFGVTVVDGAGRVTLASNVLDRVPGGAIRGMRWAEFVTGDLALGGLGEYPHIEAGGNRIG